MSIDPRQPIPLYFQLKTLLLEEILSGHYGGVDDRLPTMGVFASGRLAVNAGFVSRLSPSVRRPITPTPIFRPPPTYARASPRTAAS